MAIPIYTVLPYCVISIFHTVFSCVCVDKRKEVATGPVTERSSKNDTSHINEQRRVPKKHIESVSCSLVSVTLSDKHSPCDLS